MMKERNDTYPCEEAVPLNSEDPSYLQPRQPSSRKLTIVSVLLTVSLLLNIGLLVNNFRGKDARHDLSPYAHLPRDVPTKYNSHSPFGLGSTTEEDRAIAWESLDSSAGEISLDADWADSHSLPESAPFFWDQDRRIYLLNGHHSLHCMRKVRRAIVLYNYNRPQMDSYTHLVHCMDHLLQNIICEADDTPFYTSTTSNITTGLGQERMCRSWDRLTDWANENTACFAYINETQGVGAVIDRFRYCPRGSSYLGPMREYFGYAGDWFRERPNDIDSLPRYWEGLDLVEMARKKGEGTD
ncbi:hypothetical protein B0I35DRAFT_263446 [Stachybotrys elegans]|uniref:DUF3328 domain-containing protein n=1 Tax=Stachybotrys elegans TaxID=80388 RepID=A0A8K0SQ48_9HYPO|nr:hypothetical protein B0I35DRAFT_263446 [Stachybotrys elegans]